jgi:hypothetical protein
MLGESAVSERLECLGGPSDGQRIPDRGMFWRIMGTVDPATGKVRPGSSGTYVQRGGVYQWEPDP